MHLGSVDTDSLLRGLFESQFAGTVEISCSTQLNLDALAATEVVMLSKNNSCGITSPSTAVALGFKGNGWNQRFILRVHRSSKKFDGHCALDLIGIE